MRTRLLLVAGLLVVSAFAGCLSDGSSSDGAAAPAADGNQTASGTDGTGADDGNATASPSEDGNDTGDDPASGPDANATDGNETDADTPSYPTTFSNWGCRTTFTIVEVRKAWAAGYTPEGFEPLTFFPADALVPQAPNRTVKATFLVASNHCERVTYGGPGLEASERTDVQRLYYGVFVDPPDRYESGEKQYVYPFRFVSDVEGDAEMLSRWDLPAETGSLDLAANVDQQARSWTVTAESPEASVRMDLETAGSTSAGDEPATFRFFEAAEDGSVDRAMDYEVRVSNATQNPVRAPTVMGGIIDLDASDSPYPGPTPSPVAVTRWTPSEQVAQHAEMVTFDG